MAKIDSLLIYFPSISELKEGLETTKKERLAFYDIIINAFMYKYTYEQAKLNGKHLAYADKNLNDIKVYNKFLNEVNKKIHDSSLRNIVLKTLKNIKNNNYYRPSVKKTYETVRKWFAPDTMQGKIFRNNLATGDSRYSIDFESLFDICNKEAITEDCKLFKDVKDQYEKYKAQYDDLFR